MSTLRGKGPGSSSRNGTGLRTPPGSAGSGPQEAGAGASSSRAGGRPVSAGSRLTVRPWTGAARYGRGSFPRGVPSPPRRGQAGTGWSRGERAAPPSRDGRRAAGGQLREPACKPGSVGGSHSSRTHVAVRLQRPTRERRGPRLITPLFGLAPGGVYPAAGVTTGAVRSYRTFSPLPAPGGRYVFCGTFRGLAPPRRYLAPCPVEPGLSSPPRNAAQRLPGRLPPG